MSTLGVKLQSLWQDKNTKKLECIEETALLMPFGCHHFHVTVKWNTEIKHGILPPNLHITLWIDIKAFEILYTPIPWKAASVAVLCKSNLIGCVTKLLWETHCVSQLALILNRRRRKG